MTTEKYDIINQAESIIEQWDNEEFEFSASAGGYTLTGDHWMTTYGSNQTVPKAFAFAVSTFKKFKDLDQRMGGSDEFTKSHLINGSLPKTE